jgi:hypothetical protein
MMFVSVLAVLVCIAVVASGTAEAVEFQAFLKTHGKSYHSKEDLELRKVSECGIVVCHGCACVLCW